MTEIGIYLGTKGDSTENIEKLLNNWGELLSEEHELTAFGSARLPQTAQSFYSYCPVQDHPANNPFAKIWSVYTQCRDFLRSNNVDVLVQIWKYNTHAAGVAMAGKQSRMPVVTRYSGATFQAYTSHQGIRKLGSFLLNNVINTHIPLLLSDTMIALGPRGRSALTSRGFDPDNVVVLPPPMSNEGRFQPIEDVSHLRKKLDLPHDREIALYVGRITEDKGMEFLTQVIEEVNARRDILFVLVGEGPYRNKFSERFTQDVVRTPGHVPYSEIDQYYKVSDVYTHPSPYEGIPLVIIEALECGVPVVARQAGDIDFVTPNVVSSPSEMVSMILESDWDNAWLHKDRFTHHYQQETLSKMFEHFAH
jgi:glycosyltransferase involved in cell wall biosynthesis